MPNSTPIIVEHDEYPVFNPRTGEVAGTTRRVITLYDPDKQALIAVPWPKDEDGKDPNADPAPTTTKDKA